LEKLGATREKLCHGLGNVALTCYAHFPTPTCCKAHAPLHKASASERSLTSGKPAICLSPATSHALRRGVCAPEKNAPVSEKGVHALKKNALVPEKGVYVSKKNSLALPKAVRTPKKNAPAQHTNSLLQRKGVFLWRTNFPMEKKNALLEKATIREVLAGVFAPLHPCAPRRRPLKMATAAPAGDY
jgi:hypothetical protein